MWVPLSWPVPDPCEWWRLVVPSLRLVAGQCLQMFEPHDLPVTKLRTMQSPYPSLQLCWENGRSHSEGLCNQHNSNWEYYNFDYIFCINDSFATKLSLMVDYHEPKCLKWKYWSVVFKVRVTRNIQNFSCLSRQCLLNCWTLCHQTCSSCHSPCALIVYSWLCIHIGFYMP